MMVDNTIALRGQSLQVPNFLGMANTAAQTRNTLAQTDIDQSQEQRAQYTGEVQKSRDALAYINSPEQYLAWHESTYRNPVLGPMLSKMGVTQEQSRAKIMDELQKPGGLERLIQQSAAGADKISGIMQGRLNQMTSDRDTAAANARKAQEMAQINNLFAPTPAPTNNLPPAATAMPVATPRNTLATDPGSTEAIKNLYAPALANANVAAATPFSPSQGGGSTPDALIADINTLSAKIESLSSLARQGNQTAAGQMKLVGSELKRKQDQLKFRQDQQDRPYKVGADVVANTVTSDDGTVTQLNSRGEVINKTPGIGKTTPAFEKQVKAEIGQKNITKVLDKMFDSYDQLNKAKAIPSSSNSALQNMQAYGAASFPYFGRAVGTKEQGIRDTIEQIRPSLIQAIKNATGMSAQEMNSNVELQIQLKAASDPALQIESNIAALNNISSLYGLGKEYAIPGVGGTPEVPPDAVEYLRSNPDLAADFEAEFKLPAGSAQQYLGGGNGR
tara:strand:+ start:279 stop:1790 length:1512 start_codon:yes stop_codon:yes gene_type:complete